MGEVYRARDTRLDRVVALKVVTPGDVSLDPDRLARFAREARAVARLQHPHICIVYDVGTDDTPYLVLEYLTGDTLAERLSAGPVPIDEAIAWIGQLGSALAYAHEQGVVHRDLKPSNVIITATGAKLLDFGLASVAAPADDTTMLGDHVTGTGVVMGTPGYLAPEQVTASAVDARADIFSFGALCYEILTGAPAFRRATPAESLGALFGPSPVPASQVRPGLPAAIDAVLERCIARDPAERFAGMSEAVDLMVRTLRGIAAPAAGAPPVADLPTPPSRLIGRDRDLDAVGQLLAQPGARLVTLTGPGGTGKTRLAVEVARLAQDRYPGGVRFVPLASVTAPMLFESAVAQALVVKHVAGRSLAAAVAATFAEERRGATLLVLDNFEQLVEAAPVLAELQAAVTGLDVLVTSRSVLRLTGEHEYPVPPLDVPTSASRMSLADLEAVPAVALFVERARAANPAFALTPDSAPVVARICARLDGLPLALELAAARVRVITPQALLPRLEHRLRILTSGARDLPLRQQTLRNTIAWSYDLLTEPEQRLVRRMSRLNGGGTLEAIEAVSDANLDLGIDVLDGVSSLADKSLILQPRQADDESRFTMLETIREYVSEQLATAGELDEVARAHAAYFLLLAEDGNTAMSGPDGDLWLDRFGTEHDNFRAAFDWMVAAGQADWGLRFGLALFHFWQRREHHVEARGRLEQLLALRRGATSTSWVELLMYTGMLCSELGDEPATDRALLEGLAMARALGATSLEAVILNNLGIAHRQRGSYLDADRYLGEALAHWRAAGDESSVARTLTNLASIAAALGALDRSQTLSDEALAIFERRGDTANVAVTLQSLGDTCRAATHFAEAEAYYRRAMASYERLDDELGQAGVRLDLGSLAVARGQMSQGRALLGEAIDAFESVGSTRALARAIEELAIAAAHVGQHSEALRLAGGAAGIRQRVGLAASADELDRLAPLIDPLRATLGARDWLEGMELDNAAVVAAARVVAAS